MFRVHKAIDFVVKVINVTQMLNNR